MKEATIKALQELCDALMKEMNLSCDSNRTKILIAADRLKRVLDEEQPLPADWEKKIE